MSRHREGVNPQGSLLLCVLGLVGAGGVEVEVAEDFAGLFVDDADVGSVDEGDDGLVFVGSSDSDFVEGAVVADGDFA